MTYIHPAAGLVARIKHRRPVNQHEARDFGDQVKGHTSGPIATCSAGMWLRDRAESILVPSLEQLVECCWDCSLLQRDGTTWGCQRWGGEPLPTITGNRSEGAIQQVPFPRFKQQHSQSGFLGEPSGENTARSSYRGLRDQDGQRPGKTRLPQR